MKLQFRMSEGKAGLYCENCGKTLTSSDVYVREVSGKAHYFCCTHCADDYEERSLRCC